LQQPFEKIRAWYLSYDIWAVAIAGFTPIPYKVFTIAAGAFEMDVWRFSLASLFSRGARFFLLAWMIYRYGAAIKVFIDRYFNILTVVFMALLIGFFLLIAGW
jgi:membrane protein YqaA with SNARE-associated domain